MGCHVSQANLELTTSWRLQIPHFPTCTFLTAALQCVYTTPSSQHFQEVYSVMLCPLFKGCGPGTGSVGGLPSGEPKASGNVDIPLCHVEEHQYVTFQEC